MPRWRRSSGRLWATLWLWCYDAPLRKTGRHVRAPAHVYPWETHVRARFDTRRLVVDYRKTDRHAGLARAGCGHAHPAAIALIALLFTELDRPVAYGINGMTAAVGVGLGYMLGGLCAEYVGWRWAFYVNLPVASSRLGVRGVTCQ